MALTPRITGLIDSSLGDWRAMVYALVNPQVTAIYTAISIGDDWYYTKAINAGNNSTTSFVGPWPDESTAISMMSEARIRDGF